MSFSVILPWLRVLRNPETRTQFLCELKAANAVATAENHRVRSQQGAPHLSRSFEARSIALANDRAARPLIPRTS
jgi:hypothetical protein